MKQLQIVNAVLAAAGAAFALILGVVCVIYLVYLDAAPRLRAEMPLLLSLTGCCAALMLAGGLAFVAQRRRWGVRWGVQGLPLLPLSGLALLLGSLK